jgi:hypothetical protein
MIDSPEQLYALRAAAEGASATGTASACKLINFCAFEVLLLQHVWRYEIIVLGRDAQIAAFIIHQMRCSAVYAVLT